MIPYSRQVITTEDKKRVKKVAGCKQKEVNAKGKEIIFNCLIKQK